MPGLSLAGKAISLAGVVILLIALCWMIINLDKADNIIGVWIPFMIAGTLLVLLGIYLPKSGENS